MNEQLFKANFSLEIHYLRFFILYFLVDLFQGVVVNPQELEWFRYGRHRGGGRSDEGAHALQCRSVEGLVRLLKT